MSFHIKSSKFCVYLYSQQVTIWTNLFQVLEPHIDNAAEQKY